MDGIFGVVHRICDVIRPVHRLLLEAGSLPRSTSAQPLKNRPIILIEAELLGAGASPPRVFTGRIQTCAGQVQADTFTRRVFHFCLESCEHAQCLGITFEPTNLGREAIEFSFTIVTEGRMTKIVSQPSDFNKIWVAAKCVTKLAGNLGHLKGVS